MTFGEAADKSKVNSTELVKANGGAGRHEALCKVPVFRPVAIRLLAVLTKEDVDLFEVADLLNSDPGFSTEILTLANSAAYAMPNRINTVERAIVTLGIERTRTLVTRAALQGMVRGLEENAAVQNCWVHSRATAAIAGWLAPYYRIHPDRAYTFALMHDIGRLGLLSAHGGRYADLLARASGTNADLMDAERMLFGVDHCEAGEWLTRTWALPQEFQHTSRNHHRSTEGAPRDSDDLAACACALSQALGFRAAPLVDSEALEALLERVPDAVSPRARLAAADLSTYVSRELHI